jgi:PAS domain S-box-containing protein
VIDQIGTIVEVSNAYCALTGYTRGELINHRLAELEDPSIHDLAVFDCEAIERDGSVCFESRHRAKDGRILDVEISATYVTCNGGCFLVLVRNIGGRKQSEEALRKSEERYRAFVEQSSEGIWRIESEVPIPIETPIDQQVELFYKYGYLAECNSIMAQMYGFSSHEEIAGVRLEHLLPSHDPNNVSYLRSFIRSGYRLTDAESCERDRLGHDRYFLNNLIGIVEKGFLQRAWGTQRDITERKEVEQAIRRSEERYREMFEQDFTGCCIYTPSGRILVCNQAFARIFGFESASDALGCELGSLFPTARALDDFLSLVRTRRSLQNYETELCSRDGRTVYVVQNVIGTFDDSGQLIEVKSYLSDQSERKALEEQLRHSQKMEAVGRLAGGIAHDFNNLLTAITGYSELLLDRLDEVSPFRVDVEEIKRAGERAAALTRQLLTFSRRKVLKLKVMDLNLIVEEMDKLLRRLIGENLHLTTELDPLLGSVKADGAEIEQVLLNLAVNARDAMPQSGKITIQTANVEIDESFARGYPPIETGSYVVLTVSDTGVGMNKETQSQIFEPFFTTKPPGKGTGLGLSTVYGIVKQTGGHIDVESELGRGTTFRIYLPRVERAVEGSSHKAAGSNTATGSETILLVEDDDGVRGLIKAILTSVGYKVLEATNGFDALQISQTHKAPDLVITDLVMPKMNGRELIQHLGQLFSEIKVLYISGYTDEAVVSQGLERGASFLQKPFAPSHLAEKVRDILDREKSKS